jgi:hypothetical protein
MKNFLIKIIMNLIKRFTKKATKKLYLLLGDILISNSRKKYDNYKKLEEAEIKIFSQNGEDGIIDYLIKKIEINKPSFVEIGVGDYTESNTRYLYETYYSKGLIVDLISDLKNKVSKNVSLWKGNLQILEKGVNPNNIEKEILNKVDFPIDIFSIDIDGIDYWVIKNIKPKISKIFILEFNPIFGAEKEVTVPSVDNFSRTDHHYSNLYFGASLNAYVKLLEEKGFYLLGVNRLRNNAFFINNDFKKEVYFENIRNFNINEIEDYNFSESRDKNGNLSFLKKKEALSLIKECDLLDLSNKKNKKIKIKDLYKI